jgi:hypothetical protein
VGDTQRDRHTQTYWWFDKPTFIFWKQANNMAGTGTYEGHLMPMERLHFEIRSDLRVRLATRDIDRTRCLTGVTHGRHWQHAATSEYSVALSRVGGGVESPWQRDPTFKSDLNDNSTANKTYYQHLTPEFLSVESGNVEYEYSILFLYKFFVLFRSCFFCDIPSLGDLDVHLLQMETRCLESHD